MQHEDCLMFFKNQSIFFSFTSVLFHLLSMPSYEVNEEKKKHEKVESYLIRASLYLLLHLIL